MPRSDRLRILVSGMLAGDPGQGGATWAVLQYVLGLRRLGHDVVFVEPLSSRQEASERYFERVIDSFGLSESSSLLVGRETAIGLPYAELTGWARTADVVLDISGLLTRRGALGSRAGTRLPGRRPGVHSALALGRRSRHESRRAHALRHRRAGDRPGRLRRPNMRPRLDRDVPACRAGRVARCHGDARPRVHERRQLARLRLDRVGEPFTTVSGHTPSAS